MISVLSAFAGILGSIIPELIGFFLKKQLKEQEVKLAMIKSHNTTLFDSRPPKHPKDAGSEKISTLIRPLITCGFFLLFCLSKMMMVYAWKVGEINTQDLIRIFWDLETRSIFAAIVGFWFGHRAFKKFKFKS